MSFQKAREILTAAGLVENEIIDDPVGQVVATIALDLAQTEGQLDRAADSLEGRMARLRETLAKGGIVNGLGEVQHLGNDVDRLCAARKAQQDSFAVLVKAYRETREGR